jgi:hypothetical protein
MTEDEAEMLREIEKAAHEATAMFIGDDVPAEFGPQIIGTILAVADALFAIRDGEPWRGTTNPRKIAEKVLREAGIGE